MKINETIFDKIMREEYDGWGICLPNHNWCTNTLVEVEFIIKVLELDIDHKVLDLFCSWGRHVIELKKRGYSVKGMDKSKELIDKANELAQSENIRGDFIRADVLTYNGKDQYGAIYSLHSSVFEAWRTESEIIEYLRKIYNMLKKDSTYLFGWNNNWNRADGAEKRWKRILEEKGIELSMDKLPFHYYGYDEQKKNYRKIWIQNTKCA